MDKQILQFLIPGIGLISGLIATYVSLQNRVLLAEVRRELAELENRIILRINGTFARETEVTLRESHLRERMQLLEDDLRTRTAAGG